MQCIQFSVIITDRLRALRVYLRAGNTDVNLDLISSGSTGSTLQHNVASRDAAIQPLQALTDLPCRCFKGTRPGEMAESQGRWRGLQLSSKCERPAQYRRRCRFVPYGISRAPLRHALQFRRHAQLQLDQMRYRSCAHFFHDLGAVNLDRAFT